MLPTLVSKEGVNAEEEPERFTISSATRLKPLESFLEVTVAFLGVMHSENVIGLLRCSPKSLAGSNTELHESAIAVFASDFKGKSRRGRVGRHY